VVVDTVVVVVAVAVVVDVIVCVSVKVTVSVVAVRVVVTVVVDNVVPSHERHRTGHRLLTAPSGQKRSRPAHCGVSNLPLQRSAHFSILAPNGSRQAAWHLESNSVTSPESAT